MNAINIFPDHARKDGSISKYVQCWSWAIIDKSGKCIASNGGMATKLQAREQALSVFNSLAQAN